jgi:protein TonB
MTGNGLTFSVRLVSIGLAAGIHAAAAAAFMLAPAKPPPPPPPAVEIELLAEITAEAAAEVVPAVAAETTEAEEAQESEPGAAKTISGSEAGEVAARDDEKAEMAPDEVKPVEQANNMPEVESPAEAEPIEEPDVASLSEPTEVPEVAAPVELETPVIEAPQAPAISSKPKPKPAVQKKVKKKVQRRATLAGSTTRKIARRPGASEDVKSGGSQASAQYRSVVNARLAARRSAIQSRAAGARGRVVIFFTIGASGSVVSASVSQSSGNAKLDSVARAIIASTSFPPPPGGSYRNGVPIALK